MHCTVQYVVRVQDCTHPTGTLTIDLIRAHNCGIPQLVAESLCIHSTVISLIIILRNTVEIKSASLISTEGVPLPRTPEKN